MKGQKLFLILSTVILLGGIAGQRMVLANSAQRNWRGVSATGAIVTDEDCPLVVEEEQLTFAVSEFPQSHYQTENDFLTYTGMVTAEYSFYNPADYTVTAKLVFPFGAFPDYGYDRYDEQRGNRIRSDDTAKYAVKVNGREIEKRLRHTLSWYYEQFDLNKDMGRLRDGFWEDDFYSPDLEVTRYIYAVSGVDQEKNPAATAALDIPKFDGRTKFFLEEERSFQMRTDGSARLDLWAKNGQEVILNVIGEVPSQEMKWAFYKDGGAKDGEEIDGAMTLLQMEKLSLRELALMKYPANSGIAEADWYNAIVEMFRQSSKNHGGGIFLMNYPDDLDISDALMRWYEYEITLEPGQRLTNTVEAPLYPSIDTMYEPPVFGYTYLLSPAQTWAQFGRLKIRVNTPFFLTESSLPEFVQTNDGYLLDLAKLPAGELTFSLSESQKPKAETQVRSSAFYKKMLIAAFITVAVFGFVIGVVRVLRGRKK